MEVARRYKLLVHCVLSLHYLHCLRCFHCLFTIYTVSTVYNVNTGGYTIKTAKTVAGIPI